MKRLTRLAVIVAVMLGAVTSPARSQTASQRGKVIITVADQSGAIVPGATVTMVGLDPATKAVATPPAKSDDKGVVTFERVVLGRYSIQGQFPGFDLGLLRDVRVKAGDNKHLVILPLKQMTESVTVSQDTRTAGSTRPSIGLALTREQIEALSDDPDEMQRQLQDIAGAGARFRVDSFEGSQLPPKAQIKSIHITRDQYAAESHSIGELFIDIVTQPGMGPLRVNGNLGYNGSALNSRTQLQPKKGPEQNRNFGMGMGGTIAKRRTDFSLNLFGNDSYSTPFLNASAANGSGPRVETLNLRTPFKSVSLSGTLNHALTRDQTIRISANVGRNSQENLGVGNYSYPERAFSTRGHNYSLNLQEVGPLGRRFFINTRAAIRASVSRSESVLEAPTIVVTDAFNSGGAQRGGGTRSRSVSVLSDLDYIRGIQSWRAGVQIDGTWFHSDDQTNYLGTYTFTSMENYLAGKPTFFSKRIGDPTIEYSNVQGGVYLQDDIRVSKTLTLSPGIRYELQTHVTDYNGFAPRFGMTWSPFKSGKTTIRGGGGLFYEWLQTGSYAQTIRLDGFHQRNLTITNPTYPDPGDVGRISQTDRYLLGPDYVLPRNVGANVSLDQAITNRIRFSASYTFSKASQVARGRNLNAPLGGVRPDGRFLNVIETVSDAQARSQAFSISSSFSLIAPSAAANLPRINWKRLSFNAFYSGYHMRNNSDGPFSVPASGSLASEWGPSLGRPPHAISFNINSGIVKNVSMGGGFNMQSGSPYNILTGIDNNGDQILNDRPAGVSRNSARVPVWNLNSNLRLGYTWSFGHGAATTPQGIAIPVGALPAGLIRVEVGAGPVSAAGKYRLSINVSASNLTNRSNYGGYTGVMTSPFFGKPNSSGNGRRVQISTSFGF